MNFVKLGLKLVVPTIALVAGTAVQAADVSPQIQFVPPPPPPPAVSGYLGVFGGIGWSHYDDDGTLEDDTYGVFGGSGAANYWVVPGSSSIQLDVNAQATTDHPECCGDGTVYGSIGGHWSARSDAHLLGVFGGFSATNEIDYEGSNTQGLIGLEGQIYLNNWTLYGQAGYIASLQGGNDYSADLWFGRLNARVFLSPNTKLQGEIGYAAGTYTGDGDDANFLTWGASLEHQMAGTPVSAFIDYSGVDAGGDPDYNLTEHQVVAGVRLNFGQATLMDQDRNGATLDLPNILLRSQAWDYALY